MDHDVYELHAGNLHTNRSGTSNIRSLHPVTKVANLSSYHKVDVVVVVDEVLHELLKAVLFFAHLTDDKNMSECAFKCNFVSVFAGV